MNFRVKPKSYTDYSMQLSSFPHYFQFACKYFAYIIWMWLVKTKMGKCKTSHVIIRIASADWFETAAIVAIQNLFRNLDEGRSELSQKRNSFQVNEKKISFNIIALWAVGWRFEIVISVHFGTNCVSRGQKHKDRKWDVWFFLLQPNDKQPLDNT